jgi:hypothetical protein
MRHKWLMLAAVGASALAWMGAGADAANVGQRCGGSSNVTCDAGLWCEPAAGSCNATAAGHCVKVPQVCTEVFKPVCGCNGRTYPNDCHRRMDKQPKRHDGPC